MHTFYGRPRGMRDGVRNSASELEGCLGAKIHNFRCSFGCFGIAAFLAIAAAIVILVLKLRYHLF